MNRKFEKLQKLKFLLMRNMPPPRPFVKLFLPFIPYVAYFSLFTVPDFFSPL